METREENMFLCLLRLTEEPEAPVPDCHPSAPGPTASSCPSPSPGSHPFFLSLLWPSWWVTFWDLGGVTGASLGDQIFNCINCFTSEQLTHDPKNIRKATWILTKWKEHPLTQPRQAVWCGTMSIRLKLDSCPGFWSSAACLKSYDGTVLQWLQCQPYDSDFPFLLEAQTRMASFLSSPPKAEMVTGSPSFLIIWQFCTHEGRSPLLHWCFSEHSHLCGPGGNCEVSYLEACVWGWPGIEQACRDLSAEQMPGFFLFLVTCWQSSNRCSIVFCKEVNFFMSSISNHINTSI